jgi:hypothetical protein
MRSIKVLFCLALFSVCSNPIHAVGFRTIEKEGLKVSVWYPSMAEEKEIRYGPFDANFAIDAIPTEGKYQPVLFSHGYNGRVRNHYLTAKAIAEAGFIVIAPLHTPDHLIDTDDRAMALNWRTRELLVALELVMRDSVFKSILDIYLIHGLGYSLGAITVIQGAGATIDLTAVDDHCDKNSDVAFCEKTGWYLRHKLRRIRGVDVHDGMRETPNVFNTFPYINGNIALVAPVGQGAVINNDFFKAKKVFVVGLESDVVTVPEYHAKYLEAIVPSELLYESVLLPGHHAAFIAPFSERVTSVEEIPDAKDPDGFNRKEFLKDLNARLQNFYKCCR